MENTLEQFPAWVQTIAYIGTAVIGLAVASHGYFKAWTKKLVSAKTDPPEDGKLIGSVMVMDAAAIRNLADALLRVDTTLRSIQDDLHRGHDRSDRSRDQMEDLIGLLSQASDRDEREQDRGAPHGPRETMRGRDHD